MNNKIVSSTLMALALWVCFAWSSKSTEATPEKRGEEEKINWMTVEEAFAAAQNNPKKVFIDVYTDWCGWCKRMDKDTFSDPEIVEYMNKNFYAVKFNAEQKEAIKLGGQTFEFVDQGRRGYHQLAAALMQGKMSYPTVVILNEQFQLLQPIPGYRKPAEMKKVLEFFANDQHLKETDSENK